MDATLPQGGLNRSGVHEFSGAAHADTAAASGYLLALLKQLSNTLGPATCDPILWCQTARARCEFGAAHGVGFDAFGFNSGQFLFAEAARNCDLLWALEEGARSSSFFAVVGEIDSISFTQTRRLTLAAEAGGTPILLLKPYHELAASAAETRWCVAATPGGSDPFVPGAPGHPRWHLELLRCRGGRPNAWTVEWNNETYRFGLVEQFSSRSPGVAGASYAYPKLRSASG